MYGGYCLQEVFTGSLSEICSTQLSRKEEAMLLSSHTSWLNCEM